MLNKELKKIENQMEHQRFNIKDLLICALFILIGNLSGYLASLVQTSSLRAWYPILNKSILTPPSIVFPIVWSTLFIIIGISTFLSYHNANKKSKIDVLFMYFMQLLFSFLWSVIFFGFRAPIMGFVEVLFLIFIIIRMMITYRKSSELAYLLLYPYLLWCIFASYLNLIIIIKN